MPSPRAPVPAPIVVGILLFLLAPALLHHISTNPLDAPAASGARERLEATALPAAVEVKTEGTPPTRVTVSVPYPVQGNTAGAAWTGTDVLLRAEAIVGVPPRVNVALLLPDGERRTVTLDGVLTVSGAPPGAVTVRVTNAGATPLEARVTPGTGVVSVTLRPPAGEAVSVTHQTPGLALLSDPATGDPRAFMLRNPTDQVQGLPASALAGTPLAAFPPLVSVQQTASGVLVGLLGDTVSLDGAALEGDPLKPEGLLVGLGAGEPLLTLRAYPPSTARGTVRVELDGPAAALLVPGAASVKVETSAGKLPLGLVVVTAANGPGASTDDTVRVLDATTGGRLVAVTAAAAGALYESALLGHYETLPRLAFSTSADAAGAITVAGADPQGREAVRLRAAPGEPGRLTLSFGPGWPKTGQADVDVAVASATGLASAVVGGTGSPTATVLAAPGHLPFFKAERGSDNSVRVTYPGFADTVPGGAIRVTGNPWGLAPWSVAVEKAGVAVVTARVAREPLLAGSGLARPVVTIENSAAGAPVTVAPPVALQGDLAARRLDGLTLYSPAEPGVALLAVTRSGGGFTVSTPVASQQTSATGLTFDGDPLATDSATFTLRDAGGSRVATFTLDRAAGTVRVSGLGQDQVVGGAVAYSGDPLNPLTLVVRAPDGRELLRYDRSPSGTGGSLAVLGETRVRDSTLLRLEGDPRSVRGFAFVVRDPASGKETKYTVSQLTAPAGGVVPLGEADPLLSIVESYHAPEPRLVRLVDAAGQRADAAALRGTFGPWLALAGPHKAYLAVPASDDAYTRISLRYSAGGEPGHDAASATFERIGDEGGWRFYQATFAPVGGNGRTLHLTVRYDTALTPFAVQTVEEKGYKYRLDGQGPLVGVTAPATTSAITFAVSWDGEDAESGVASFAIDSRAGSGPWERWLEAAPQKNALFTGEAGVTYQFRARGIDRAGNAGPWSPIATTEVSDLANGTNSPPTVRILAPEAGDVLSGVVDVLWEAEDPDGTPVIVNLYASADNGRTWKSLYSGDASTYAWDTTAEPNGAQWKLKILATDGSLKDADATGRFTLKNLLSSVVGALPIDDGGQSGGGGGEGPDDGGEGGEGTGGEPGVLGDASLRLWVILGATTVVLFGVGLLWGLRRRHP